MSPENQGVFKPLKEVVFQGNLTFFTHCAKCDLWYQPHKTCAESTEFYAVCAH